MSPQASTPGKAGKKFLLPYIRELLNDPSHSDTIRWTDDTRRQFKIVNRQKMAELWGATKAGRKSTMTYDNMCRGLRAICARGKVLEKVGGAARDQWRFLEPESTDHTEDRILYSIQQLLSDVMVPNLIDSSSLEVKDQETENVAEEPRWFSWKVEPKLFESKSSRLNKIVEALNERAVSVQ